MASCALERLPCHAENLPAATEVTESCDRDTSSEDLTYVLESMRKSLPKSRAPNPRQHKKINQRRRNKSLSEQETKPKLQHQQRLSIMSDNESPNLTPKSKRPSKAKKGLPVHYCDWPGCDKGDQPFTRAEHLRRHQLNHSKCQLKCEVPGCDKTFNRDDLRLRHQKTHEKKVDKPYYTPIQPHGQYQEAYHPEASQYSYENQIPPTSYGNTIVSSYAHAPDYGSSMYGRSGVGQPGMMVYDPNQQGYIAPSGYSSSPPYGGQYSTIEPSHLDEDDVYDPEHYEYDPHMYPPSASNQRRGR